MVHSEEPGSRDAQQLSWWRAWGAVTFGGVLLALGPMIASLAIGSIISGNADWRAGVWVTVGSVLTLGAAVVIGHQQILSVRSANQAAMDLTRYNDALSGLHKSVARLLNSDASDRARQEFFRSVVGEASGLFPMDGVRVCVYELDSAEGGPDDGSAEDDHDKGTVLKYVVHGGRYDEPRRLFTEENDYGKRAIATAQGTQHRCVERVDVDTADVDRPEGSTWKAFMQVPLRLDGEAFGLLSIDCRDEVLFTRDHVTIARAAASFIVLGLAKVRRAADNLAPELSEILARLVELQAISPQSGSSRTLSESDATVSSNGTKDGDGDG